MYISGQSSTLRFYEECATPISLAIEMSALPMRFLPRISRCDSTPRSPRILVRYEWQNMRYHTLVSACDRWSISCPFTAIHEPLKRLPPSVPDHWLHGTSVNVPVSAPRSEGKNALAPPVSWHMSKLLVSVIILWESVAHNIRVD